MVVRTWDIANANVMDIVETAHPPVVLVGVPEVVEMGGVEPPSKINLLPVSTRVVPCLFLLPPHTRNKALRQRFCLSLTSYADSSLVATQHWRSFTRPGEG